MSTARLFLIDGTSGVWKEELVQYIDHVLVNATVVRKFTTRSPRQGEDFRRTDLDRIDDLTFRQVSPDYAYEYGGYKYGIKRDRISAALSEYASVFVIVRNAEIIDAVRRDFRTHCPTSAFIYMDRELVAQRLRAIPGSELAVSVQNAFLDYLRSPDSYDEVILNAGAPNDFFRLVDLLIQRGHVRPSFIRSARDEGPGLIVATSRRARRLFEVVLATMSTACIAFGVDLVTSGQLNYWKTVVLVFDIGLLIVATMAAAILLVAWRESE
jgi:guanylate kinase